jgi:hypothetical protein
MNRRKKKKVLFSRWFVLASIFLAIRTTEKRKDFPLFEEKKKKTNDRRLDWRHYRSHLLRNWTRVIANAKSTKKRK